MRLRELKCPNCGANLHLRSPDDRIVMCDYCGTVVYIEEEVKSTFLDEVSLKERGDTELALVALRGENFIEAKEKFEEALQYNPRNNIAWLGKAAADLGMGNLRESLAAFEKAIELGTDINTIVSWGDYLISRAMYQKRTNTISQMQLSVSNVVMIFSGVSGVGNLPYDDYIRRLQEMIYKRILSSLSHNMDEYVISYALKISMTFRDYENMHELSTLLLDKNPNSPIGRYHRGVSALYLGRPMEAVEFLYPLTTELSQNYNVFIYLGYAYARAGRYDYACDALLDGYYRLRRPEISSALRSIYSEWYAMDRKSAKRWRKEKKRTLKLLDLEL